MRILVLSFFLCLAVFSAQAQSPEYAKKAAAATAEAAATDAAARANAAQAAGASAPADDQNTAQKPVVDSDTKAAALSEQDKADVARIEAYLNDLKSISADFLQVGDQGDMMRGEIAIERPGKMRVTYAPPSQDFIVADGDFVHIWDGSLKSQTNVPEDSSLANFILRRNISLSGGVTVTKFQRFPGKMELTLVQTKDPGLGQLTLIFEDHPLLLRQWKVLDAQGRITGVNLENERSGVEFPGGTFNFVPPSFGKSGKEQ
jgi:outer membrane lipoprotein-sorting protein